MAKRILVIDDEEILRSMLREVLKVDGYHVDTAPSGEEGIALHRKEAYDLVIVDNNMPGGIEGLDVLAELRSGPSPTPVILMTAYNSMRVSMRAHELGAAGFLLKPFDDITAISKEVASVLSRADREKTFETRLRGKP
jgi:CheY-like chemotaxis protein